MDQNKLLGKMREKGLTQDKVAMALGICLASLRRKIYGLGQFTLSEILKLTELLELSNIEILEIFFARKVS